MMFNREYNIRNQARNREISKELFSHNRIEEIIDVENNLFLKNNKAFNHAHDTFKSSENEDEVDRINSISNAKNLRK